MSKDSGVQKVASSKPARVRIYYWPHKIIGDPSERSVVCDEDVASEIANLLENMGYYCIIESD